MSDDANVSMDRDEKMPAARSSFPASDSGSDTDEHHHSLQFETAADGHRTTAAKPALKKNRKQKQESDHQKKQLKFDEETIAEHNKLRGTRQSIDEPNTPYHAQYDSGAESDGSGRCKSPANQKPSVDWDLLQTRLDSVAAVQQTYPSSPSASSCQADEEEVVADDRKSEMRQLEFKEHRKRHYNEMELVRQFRSQHSDDAAAEAADENGHYNGRNGDDYDRNADADNEEEDDDEDEDLNE